MSVFDSIRDAFTRAPRSKMPAKDSSSGLLARLSPFGVPPHRGTRELLRAYRTSPWLRAVVGKIATETSSAGWVLQKGTKKGASAIEAHAFLDLVAKPNPVMFGDEFVELVQVWRDSKGEAFVIIERNAAGVPVQLWPIPPHWILQTPTASVPFFRGSFGAWQAMIPQDDVLWMRDFDPDTPYWRGIGIGESLADELDTDEYASKRMSAFFYNGTSPEIIVSAEGASDPELKAAKEKWESNYRGFWNSFRTFWTGAKIAVTRLDTSFKDMDLVKLRASLRDTFIQAYGMPPEKLGIVENSNRATIDSADYLFAKGLLLPRLRKWGQVWGHILAQFPDGKGLAYVFVSPVPEDKAFTLEVTKAHPTAFTTNEIRKLGGHEPIAGGDALMSAPAPPMALMGDPEWVRSLPPRRKAEPPPSDDPPRVDVTKVLEALRPQRLTAEIEPVWQERVDAWAKDVLDDLGQSAKFDLLNPLIAPHIRETAGTRITNLVNETTREQLRASLAEGVEAGESIDDLSIRVEDVFGEADQTRADSIARTEVVRSSNWATYESHKISGVVDDRGWVATKDDRTRETHEELDGVIVSISDLFVSSSGASTFYPGGFGVAEEDIECRCTSIAVISDDLGDDEEGKALRARLARGLVCIRGADGKLDAAMLTACWKAYDKKLVPWERAAATALRAGFAKQRSDVLKALREAAK